MTTHALSDTATLTGRSLRHIARSPDTIITAAVMPIAIMLMFVYVFGGAIDTGSASQVNYMLPGILLITVASGVAYTATRLFTDVKSGIFERFRAMPLARASALWAHVLTSAVANLVAGAIEGGGGLRAGCRGVVRCGRCLFSGPDGVPPGGSNPRLGHAHPDLERGGRGVGGEECRGRRRVLLPADLPPVHLLGLRPHRIDARPGAMVRRAPAGNRDRRCDPQPLCRPARGRRHLDGGGVVRGNPDCGLCPCAAPVPTGM